MRDVLAADHAGHDRAIVPAAAGTLFKLHVLPDVQVLGVVIQIRPDVIDYLMCDRQYRAGPSLREALFTQQLLDEGVFVRLVRGSAVSKRCLLFRILIFKCMLYIYTYLK